MEALPDAPAPEPPKPTVYNKSFLDAAQPGFEWLSPESGFAPPIASVHIAIKHAPNAKVELVQNGDAVSQFNFEGLFTNEAHTVALSRWRGVDLVEGDNTFVARELDESGNVLATIERVIHYAGPPFKVELAARAVGAGRGRPHHPVIAVRLTDKDGKPAREGAVGSFERRPALPAAARRERARAAPPGRPAARDPDLPDRPERRREDRARADHRLGQGDHALRCSRAPTRRSSTRGSRRRRATGCWSA